MNIKWRLVKKTEFLSIILLLLVNNFSYSAKKSKTVKDTDGQVKTTYTSTSKKSKKNTKETTAEETAAAESTDAETTEKTEENTAADVSAAETIMLPTQKRTFFYKIDPEIVAEVEKGSPESLRSAMTKLRKNESEYEENEKVLIAVAAEIMKTVWPSEKITWDVFEVTSENSYTGAINSANKGVFDSSTGNTDFLLTVIPALVLLKPTATSDVMEPCEEALREALAINQKSVFANYLMGELLSRKNEYKAAEPYFAAAYEQSAETKEIIIAYSNCLRENGNVYQASYILSTIDPGTDVSILKQNAYLSFAKKDYNAAEEYVARVLQQTPNDLEFLLFRAKILIEQNDYIHAVTLLDMYARQENSSLEYLLLRARVQLDWSKNTTAAAETIEKALSLYPDSIDVLKVAARIASTTDSKVGGFYADEFAEKILEKDPESPDALTYALNGLIQRKSWNEAYETCKKIIQKGGETPEIIQKYVEICLNSNKKTEAYEYAKSKKEANPGDETILQAYIYAYSQTGTADEVKQYIDSLMGNASTKLKSYLYYRRSFLQTTEDSQLADLRSSLISNPRNSDSLFRLYEIYFAKKDYRKAQYYLRQVVAINPNDTAAKKLNEDLTAIINQ